MAQSNPSSMHSKTFFVSIGILGAGGLFQESIAPQAEKGGSTACTPRPFQKFIRNKKAQECLCILGLWTNGLGPTWDFPGNEIKLRVLVGLFSHHKWMVQDPHFIHRDCKHDQKCDCHQNITS